jgi:uncharacterized protein DUF3291
MTHHLAQINVGRILYPLDDPRMAGFMTQLDPVNAIADKSPGFIWRLQTAAGNATDIPFSDVDPFFLLNMSVWESLESLRDFTYRAHHLEVFRERAKWFEDLGKARYCLWWIPAGHIPTVAEGRERIEHFWQHGSTPFSFWFSQPFPEPQPEVVGPAF